ncbi:MAG: exo-alpha-sialidase [Candidatus Hydrogenedentes bacterium]|nr:exo-alpha-sialidase [Candidatus Hydrogenedentota bacterium]
MPIPPARRQPEEFEREVAARGGRVDFVFEDDRPFAQCHASTVVEVGNGDLLCAWFGGTAEKDPDVGIWLSRFHDGRWAAPVEVAKVKEMAHWNPVLFRDPERGVSLFFKVGPDVPTWQTYWMTSTDEGATWSEPRELVPGDVGGRGPVKNKPIILADGAWLAPASTELDGWKPFADRSEDGGVSWARSADFAIDPATIPGIGGIQPTFWEAPPGHVHALLRTAGGVIGRADSTDSGRTWSAVRPSELPNNNSGLDALGLADGRVVLIYNPVSANWGARTPLTLAVSRDNGATWENAAHLETEQGEYSYPAIVAGDQGIVVTYTWKRERVRCWQIPLGALD